MAAHYLPPLFFFFVSCPCFFWLLVCFLLLCFCLFVFFLFMKKPAGDCSFCSPSLIIEEGAFPCCREIFVVLVLSLFLISSLRGMMGPSSDPPMRWKVPFVFKVHFGGAIRSSAKPPSCDSPDIFFLYRVFAALQQIAITLTSATSNYNHLHLRFKWETYSPCFARNCSTGDKWFDNKIK